MAETGRESLGRSAKPMSSPLSKDQEKLRGRDVRTMSDHQLSIWISACETMAAWVPHKNGRKGWRDSKKLAEAIQSRRLAKRDALSSLSTPNHSPDPTLSSGTSRAGHEPRHP